VGFSLGANVMVHVLARGGEGSPLRAGAAVSVPYDLAACARALDSTGGWNRLYRTVFMRSIRRKALAKARAHPGALDERVIRAARGLEAFDDAVIAPIYGFQSARDYYAHCSSAPVLGRIRRPTLLLGSADDPMIPARVIPRDDNPWLSWLITDKGGHVGFVAGTPWHPFFWAERQVLEFFARHLA
jgi:predicted alpha/beta-fold hydrolase